MLKELWNLPYHVSCFSFVFFSSPLFFLLLPSPFFSPVLKNIFPNRLKILSPRFPSRIPIPPINPINPISPLYINIIRYTFPLRSRPQFLFLCYRTCFSSFISTVLRQKAHKFPKIFRKSFVGSENSSTFASAFEREAHKKKRSLNDLHKTDK